MILPHGFLQPASTSLPDTSSLWDAIAPDDAPVAVAVTIPPEWAYAVDLPIAGAMRVLNDTHHPSRSLAGAWIALHAGRYAGNKSDTHFEGSAIEAMLAAAREAGLYATMQSTGISAGYRAVIGIQDPDPDHGQHLRYVTHLGAASAMAYQESVPRGVNRPMETASIIGRFQIARILRPDAPARGHGIGIDGWRIPGKYSIVIRRYQHLKRPISHRGTRYDWKISADVQRQMQEIGWEDAGTDLT